MLLGIWVNLDMAWIVLHLHCGILKFFLLCLLKGPLTSRNCIFTIISYWFPMDLESLSVIELRFWWCFSLKPWINKQHFQHYTLEHAFASLATSLSLFRLAICERHQQFFGFTLYRGLDGPMVTSPILHGSKETLRLFLTFSGWMGYPLYYAMSTPLLGSRWKSDHVICVRKLLFA